MSSTDATTDASSSESAADMKKVMMDQKGHSGKSVWATTLETLRMADGEKSRKTDVLVDTVEEGVTELKKLMEDASKDPKDKEAFSFPNTPLELLKASTDDLLKAFVVWSKGSDDTQYNVTKAFRRLTSYARWMVKHCGEGNVKEIDDSLKTAHDCWKMHVTVGSDGQLVYWIDLGQLDTTKIKKELPHAVSVKYVVLMTHLMLLNKNAQDNGMIMIQGMANKGFMEMMTLVPMDIATKLDRLTIGVLPLRVNSMHMLTMPRWSRVLFALMGPFMSKKMKSRMQIAPADADLQAIAEQVAGGKAQVPVGFCGLEGEAKPENDVAASLFPAGN